MSAAEQLDLWSRFAERLGLPAEDTDPTSEKRPKFAARRQQPVRYRLTIEETKGPAGRELCRRAKTDPELAAAITAANERFIYGVCWPFIRPRREMEADILQEGRMGFLKALVHKYEPDRGIELITYATFWVKHAVQRWLQDNALIRVPVYAADAASKAARLGATNADEAAELSDARYIAEAWAMRAPIKSLDAPISIRDERTVATLSDFVATEAPHPDEDRLVEERRALIADVLQRLTAKERRVIAERFLNTGARGERTLKEIGEDMGVSRERVRQIEEKALARIRKVLSLRGIYESDLMGDL